MGHFPEYGFPGRGAADVAGADEKNLQKLSPDADR